MGWGGRKSSSGRTNQEEGSTDRIEMKTKESTDK